MAFSEYMNFKSMYEKETQYFLIDRNYSLKFLTASDNSIWLMKKYPTINPKNPTEILLQPITNSEQSAFKEFKTNVLINPTLD